MLPSVCLLCLSPSSLSQPCPKPPSSSCLTLLPSSQTLLVHGPAMISKRSKTLPISSSPLTWQEAGKAYWVYLMTQPATLPHLAMPSSQSPAHCLQSEYQCWCIQYHPHKSQVCLDSQAWTPMVNLHHWTAASHFLCHCHQRRVSSSIKNKTIFYNKVEIQAYIDHLSISSGGLKATDIGKL